MDERVKCKIDRSQGLGIPSLFDQENKYDTRTILRSLCRAVLLSLVYGSTFLQVDSSQDSTSECPVKLEHWG